MNVLITGAGSGIGLASALRLAQRGMHVYASVPSLAQKGAVDAAAAERGVEVPVVQLDVTDKTSIAGAVEHIRSNAGSIDAVVHSAGLGLRGFFEDLSSAEIRRLFDVNVFGVMEVTRAVLPHMRKARNGRIVIITSAGGRLATMTGSGYCAGKFALEGFGESLAQEVLGFGVRVTLIEPGLVMSPHFSVNRGQAAAAVRPTSVYYDRFSRHERLVDNILRKSHITTSDVARGVERALCSSNPNLRYVIGWRAKVLIALRRHLPDELFTRMYFKQAARLVDRTPLHPPSDPSVPAHPGLEQS